MYTDEELFIATGGARFGMRSQRRAEGKWQRTEKSEELKNWELKTKNQFEWDGLGKASIVLSKKETSRIEDDIETKKALKKRKRVIDNDEKRDDSICVKELSTPEVTNSDNSTFSSEEKDRKKRKKEKKHDKKSKKNKRKKID